MSLPQLVGDAQERPQQQSGRLRSAARRVRGWRPYMRLRDLLWLTLLAAVLMAWYRDRQNLLRLSSPTDAGASWSIGQILGAPDTPLPGDRSTAWASRSPDSSGEWVIVEFPRKVDVAKVEIVETYNPGAVRRICSVDAAGRETEVWEGLDPTPTTAAIGRSVIPVRQDIRTRRIKIYIDSAAVPGWNEIDAVALHARDEMVQWSTNAWASSSYGENQEPPRWYWP